MEEQTSKKLMADSPPATSPSASASLLTDDLIVEILSRLPVRSVHRCKCVCRLWRDLIAEPAHRKKLPQTLAGFLYTTYPGGYRHHLAGVSAATVVDPSVDASLAFLNYTRIYLEDTCNGLLLCSCYHNADNDLDERLVVCNPATQRWTELPPPPQPQPTTRYSDQRLAFDPAVSASHFHVLCFECTVKASHLTGVSIYSSRTRAWTHTTDTGLLDKIVMFSGSVFAGGMLYLPGKLGKDGGHPDIGKDDDFVLVVLDMEMEGKAAWRTVRAPRGFYCSGIGWSQGCLHYPTRSESWVTVPDDKEDEDFVLVVLDMEMEGKATWRTVRAPCGFYYGGIGWSQGCLHYPTRSETCVTVPDDDDEEDTFLVATEIAVWCLLEEDYGTQKWVLKNTSFRTDKQPNVVEREYYVAGIHPDCDTIFFVTRDAYDGDSQDPSSLASWDIRHLEFRTVRHLEKGSFAKYLPYIPTFSELTLADGDAH